MLPFSLLEFRLLGVEFWTSLFDFRMRFSAMNILSGFYELEIMPGEILSWDSEFIFVLLNYESREELRVYLSTLDLVVCSHSV
jgi:hypothetical protein